jgi:hypothetical protein
METILFWYKDNETLINLVKDIVYFFGAYYIINSLWNWNYMRKTAQIESNLKFRERIETPLEDYVIEKNKNGIKDIGIRFVRWKNYPWHLNDDGYKHILKIEYNDENQLLSSSWIDNTGIYFQEDLSSSSVYVDKNGIFFSAPSDKVYKGFTEHKNKRLVLHLPFTNIVNFDFREYIEYEPLFYIKCHYTNYKKLYSRKFWVREKLGDSNSSMELDSRKELSRYSWINYKITQVSSKLFKYN